MMSAIDKPDPDLLGKFTPHSDPEVMARRVVYVGEMLQRGFSQVEISRALGVTRHAIFHLIRKHDIPIPNKGWCKWPTSLLEAGVHIGRTGPAFWDLPIEDRDDLAIAASKAHKPIAEYLLQHYLETRNAA